MAAKRKTPTKPGWYWYRKSPEGPWQILQVYDGGNGWGLCVDCNPFARSPGSMPGEWGPKIKEPKK